MKRLLAIVLSVSFVSFFFACRNVDSGSHAGDLTVSIGESVSSAKKASKHNITLDSLKSGQTDFEISTVSGKAYPVKLSEKNVQDILSGSTAIVQTADGGMKVKIGTKKRPAPAPSSGGSGW